MFTLLPLSRPHQKPEGCNPCGYKSLCQGFAPDHVPPNPKLAFLAEALGETEMMERSPLVGATGRMFFHHLLHPVGLTRDDVILANVIKGRPPDNNYPTGKDRKEAEKWCRQYDGFQRNQVDSDSVYIEEGGLNAYDPDWFLISVHPAFVSRTWSILRVAQNDIQKAVRFSNQRKRVLVLLGEKSMSCVLPELEGGCLKWRGHSGPLDWKEVQRRFV